MKSLANIIGKNLLSFQNPRVVSPPGKVLPNRNRNLIVATPMRSGTHVLIDTVLNNLPAYRRAPLYVDLDQFLNRRAFQTDVDHGALGDRAGYVIKTHYPIAFKDAERDAAFIEGLSRDAFVITVHRPLAQIVASLKSWTEVEGSAGRLPEFIAQAERNTAACRAFRDPRADMTIEFDDLFDAAVMQPAIARIAAELGTEPVEKYRGPPAKKARNLIYMHKGLTRLLGRRAPMINTTIRVS